MLNYIRADVKRILSRKSHIFTMLLAFFVFFATLYFPNRNSQVTSVSLVAAACGALDWLAIFIGLFEMIAIFSEDFKVKTMQVAIGMGISRNKIVLCKLLEAVILLAIDSIVILLLTSGIGVLFSVAIPAAVMMDLVRTLAVKLLLSNTVFVSLTMIVLFVTQSTILSIFVYVLVGIGFVYILLSMASMFGFEWIDSLKLTRITLSYQLGVFGSRLMLGTFDFFAFLIIAVHLAVGIFATCKLFGKRELDF